MLTEDIQDKDMLYGLLLVLSCILTEKNGNYHAYWNFLNVVSSECLGLRYRCMVWSKFEVIYHTVFQFMFLSGFFL